MVSDQGVPTSVLLQGLKDRGCRITYATFMKWRQEDLIPDPLANRPGLGRGRGRVEARWLPAVIEQVEQVYRFRQERFGFDAIAVELWLSGFNVPTERVRRGLLGEWARLLGPFGTQIYRLRQKLKEADDDSDHRAIDRLARKIARRRPRFASLPPREQRATVAAWRQMAALLVFGADQAAGMQDTQRLTATLGLPDEFAALRQEPREAQWQRGVLNEKALEEALKDPAMATSLLQRILPQARFLKFIAQLPEGLADIPDDFARTLRFMKWSISLGPRSFGIGMLIIKMFRGGEDPELSNVAATVEAMVREVSKASPRFAAELMSAAQKIIPQVASKAAPRKRR